jgi:hypothetical protein
MLITAKFREARLGPPRGLSADRDGGGPSVERRSSTCIVATLSRGRRTISRGTSRRLSGAHWGPGTMRLRLQVVR